MGKWEHRLAPVSDKERKNTESTSRENTAFLMTTRSYRLLGPEKMVFWATKPYNSHEHVSS